MHIQSSGETMSTKMAESSSGLVTHSKANEAENAEDVPQSPTQVPKGESLKATHPQKKCRIPGVQVDLSKVKTKTSPHSKPSLPTPLTEYGLDEKKQARAKARANRALKEKKRKRSATFGSDEDEKEKEQERQKDEKYLQVLEDLKILRYYYYNEYRDMLDEKVNKQRTDIRQRNEADKKKQQEQEERENLASHRVKKRLAHHKVQHDENYLRNVPKSDVYLILGLQKKMVKEGKLQCQEDLDNFWLEMRKPEVFYSHFPDGLSATSSIHKSIVASATKQTSNEDEDRCLSQIAESKESSRPTTHETWAVTQRFHHLHQPSPQKISALNPSKQAAMELEIRFPKLEMPALHCFTMDLGEKPPEPEEIQLKMSLKLQEKQRRKFLKKLHKMHQLSMANSAAATRILDRHTDLAFLLEGPNLTDLISDYYLQDRKSFPAPSSAPLPQAHSRLPPITRQPEAESDGELYSDTSERAEIFKSVKHESKDQLVVYEPPAPVPLTLEQVRENSRIIEPKTLSTFWRNYAHSDRSLFLTS